MISHFCFYKPETSRQKAGKKIKVPAYFSVFDMESFSPGAAGKRLEKLMEYFRLGHSRPLAFFLHAGARQVGRKTKDNKFGSVAADDFEKYDLKNSAVKIFFEPDSKDLEPVYNEFTAISHLLFDYSGKKGDA